MAVTHEVCTDLLSFLQESPTPFHAVDAACERLKAAGFHTLDEQASWSALTPGGYFVDHQDSSLVAFVVPEHKPRSFHIVGAHTDSPNLRLKPLAGYAKEGYSQLGVEVYGGALLNSWLDRDLGISGLLHLRESDNRTTSHLVRVDEPVCRIPQLAIHLDREVNDKGLVLNRQEHLPPVWGLVEQGKSFVNWLSQLTNLEPERIVAMDLMLHDLSAPTTGGANREFIFSARLDNLAMCHAALYALMDAHQAGVEGTCMPVVALFDHEEVGSQSATGAASPLLPHVLERVTHGLRMSRIHYLEALSRSRCISADMAHAVHPNYPERHEASHRPRLGGGPVLKQNAQQRYATSGALAAYFAQLCADVEVPVQRYVARTDLPCGSTIGPITATLLGIPTVDVGNPMLSMHSSREMASSVDPASMTRVLTRFFLSSG